MPLNNPVLHPSAGWMDRCLRFSTEAMATQFSLWMLEDDASYAAKAARAAFEELERLERELSRFILHSDIARINHLRPGDRIVIGPDAFACVRHGIELHVSTFGAFDIAVGDWKEAPDRYRPPEQSPLHGLRLDESRKTVELLEGSVNLDLGGYGKGYALDRMAELLVEWDIQSALLNGGFSTVRASEPPEGETGWPVTISHPQTGKVLKTYSLRNRSLSGSGLQKGKHILDPRTGQPAVRCSAAWACTETAALSDAVSTALMVMTDEERETFLSSHPEIEGVVIPAE